ncbi:MAG: fumarate/nitrate reduction transcriptional regulator Fnr [Gammaproteobacteria bacterium]
MEPIKITCSGCRLRHLCLPTGLNTIELKKFEEIVKQPRPLQRGQQIYRPGDTFNAIYIVRSGSIKTYTTMSTGEQQVIGFHLPGELVGLDGVSEDEFTSTAEAMEMTSVCEISFSKLEQIMGQVKTLQHQVHRQMGKELLIDQQLLIQLGKMNAERRVAAFLLNISDRLHTRGFSPFEFHLPMTRIDIGNYLGLAVETVSRQFTHFQVQETIRVLRKHVVINSIDQLRSIANVDDIHGLHKPRISREMHRDVS